MITRVSHCGKHHPRVRRLLAGFVLAWVPACACAATAPADLVFRGSSILTLEPATPAARAVAVRDGRIVYVGDDPESYIGARTRVIELGARMLMPAFHDAHMHPMSGGMRLLRCALDDRATTAAVLDALAACARQHRSDPWLIANGLPDALARDPRLDRRALDRVVPRQPLAISIGPGFTLRVNTAALQRAGLEPAAGAGDDGVERSASGEATGFVSGKAMEAVRRAWPRPAAADYRRALRAASAMANRFGIVSILDASVDPAMLAAYRAADTAGELSVRVVAAQRVVPEAGLVQVDAMRAARDAIHSRRLRAGVAKIFLDGELDLYTAALLAPYEDAPDTRGSPIDSNALAVLVTRLDAAGFDLHMHAIGDRAVRAGLDALASAIAANGARDRRDQIAHDQLVDPSDLPRFAALGVAANVQPEWALYDEEARTAEQRLGAARARRLMPLRSLADAGARLVAGSDWPSTTMNPLDAAQIALTRRPLDGSAGTWLPAQRLGLMQMLRAYGPDAAWALRLEHESGAIAVGRAADLIVLDRDLRTVDPMALHTARVLLTLLEGTEVWRDPAWRDRATAAGPAQGARTPAVLAGTSAPHAHRAPEPGVRRCRPARASSRFP